MAGDIKKIIEKGVNFLDKEQQKDGGFLCSASKKFDNFINSKTAFAIVPTNIVLSSLIHLDETSAIKNIKKKAAEFLLKQKSDYWSFNYWFRDSQEYKLMPYPDDLDDAFCALAALYEYNPDLFDGETMAKIVTMLTSAEDKEGGPYNMWLVPPEGKKIWNDIDLVANSNIAFFLSLQDISLPKVISFIEQKIDSNGYEFPYNKIYPAIYFISRFYRGKKTQKIIDLLLIKQEADGKWENPLRTALAISSIINFSGNKYREQLKRGIMYLTKTQQSNGSWKPYSFYFQMRLKKETIYAGSASITTAFCLEAINKYNKISNFQFPISKRIPNSKLPKIEKDIYKAVIKKYQQRFSKFPKDFKEKAIAIAVQIIKNNKDIILLPFYFRNALGAKSEKINDDFIIQLGLANLFGWVAYTIYDDFLDEEGNPAELPIANVSLRQSVEFFISSLPREKGFASFVKKIFDIIDDANMWEVSNCRINFNNLKAKSLPRSSSNGLLRGYKLKADFGDYSQLANKSLGHALGPVAILFALGYKENSKEVKSVMQFFKNYIIARQLNDDAHDWEDDLKRGQINAVGARLLRDAKRKIDNPEKLREIFWHKTVVAVCRDISRHVKLARKDLKKLSIVKKPAVFAEMLAAIENSVEQALKEREETKKFLETYNLR